MLKKFLLKVTVLLVATICTPVYAQTLHETDAQSLLSAFAAYADLRIVSVQHSVEILASTKEATSGKWENMEAILREYQQLDDGLAVWFVRPDGNYYTVKDGLMDVKLTTRSYFPELMAGKAIVGALVVSKSSGQRSAVIAIPVTNNGKIIGAIGVSLFLDKLSDQIATIFALRPDVSFFALAPNGLTTLHKISERDFLDPRELGSETLKKAVNVMLANTSGETTYYFDDVTKTAIYRTSPLTQWKFALTFTMH